MEMVGCSDRYVEGWKVFFRKVEMLIFLGGDVVVDKVMVCNDG